MNKSKMCHGVYGVGGVLLIGCGMHLCYLARVYSLF
jgi:uncharacterized membrane protein YqgA involved in biofilm formation